MSVQKEKSDSESNEQHNKSAFQDLIVEEPDICSNCFRKIRKRRPVNQVNVKGEAYELRDSIKGIVKDDNDYGKHADFCHGDKVTDGNVPYCECGVVLPGYDRERPMSKKRFMEGAERLVQRFHELGASFDAKEFLDYAKSIKENPDSQFHDDKIYVQATEHAIDVEALRGGETGFRKPGSLTGES